MGARNSAIPRLIGVQKANAGDALLVIIHPLFAIEYGGAGCTRKPPIQSAASLSPSHRIVAPVQQWGLGRSSVDVEIWTSIRADVLAFLASAGMFVGYHWFISYQVRQDRDYSLQSVMTLTRIAWVHHVMSRGRDVLAVQTLRNSTMAATFFASTAILLIIGVLTLTGQADRLGNTWHLLGSIRSAKPEVTEAKLIFLIVDLFVAFFSFATSVRLFNHVGYMINVPLALGYGATSPECVAAELDRAGHWYGLGMRAYYVLVPLVLWLFGPFLMTLATPVVLFVLFKIDRMPGQMPSAVPEGERTGNSTFQGAAYQEL
jgi:uncharacterized membrane protein